MLSEEPPRPASPHRVCRWVAAALLSSSVLFMVVDALGARHVTTASMCFLEWVESRPVTGAAAFTGLYTVATILFVPASVLTLGSAFVFARAFGLGVGIGECPQCGTSRPPSSAVLIGNI